MTNYTYVEKIRPNIAFRQDKHSENTNIYFVLGIYKDTDKRQYRKTNKEANKHECNWLKQKKERTKRRTEKRTKRQTNTNVFG